MSGNWPVLAILIPSGVLLGLHCRSVARTRRQYSITPRRSSLRALADLTENGIDPHWPDVRRTLCAMQAKRSTEEQ